ncbi:MAG: hypothetical protein KGL42_07960 [Betaproteobacteria bacterium]|nr:hypothetical protein [Betaproteobacteria bacterium]
MDLKAHFQKQLRVSRLRAEARRLEARARKYEKRVKQMPAEIERLRTLARDRHVLNYGAVEALTNEALRLDAEADQMIARRFEIELELASLTRTNSQTTHPERT